MKNKDFRSLLNEKYLLQYTERIGARNARWGNHKRAYGDYLWLQDRDMFESIKRRYEADPINFIW